MERLPEKLEPICSKPGELWTDQEIRQVVEALWDRREFYLALMVKRGWMNEHNHAAPDAFAEFLGGPILECIRTYDPSEQQHLSSRRGRFEVYAATGKVRHAAGGGLRGPKLFYHCLRYLRRYFRRAVEVQEPEEPDIAGTHANPAPLPDADAITKRALLECITQLPEHLHVVVEMRNEGFEYKEIGEILDIQPGTVRQRAFRARKLLAPCMRDKGFDLDIYQNAPEAANTEDLEDQEA